MSLPFHHSFTGTPPVYSDEIGYGFEAGEGNFFSVKVPEGNYDVAVELAGGCTVTVKAESRRLMLEQVRGGGRFTVNVRGVALPAPPLNAPGGDRVRLNGREQGVLHLGRQASRWNSAGRAVVCRVWRLRAPAYRRCFLRATPR